MNDVIIQDTCPRRYEDTGDAAVGIDGWVTYQDSSILRCAYCGSVNPEYLLFAMKCRNFITLGPTDKDYKVYVSTPQIKYGKFYFQHFYPDQRIEFVRLMNEKSPTFMISYPGYFYVLPFFVTLGGGEDERSG